MKLAEVFRYELESRLRSRDTWAYAVLLFGFAVAMGVDVGPLDDISANAPKQLAYDMVIVGLFGLVVSAGVFGDAALRDIESGMDPLLFTLPIRKIDHLGGRYLAALVTNAMLLAVIPLGFAVPTLIGYPDPAHFGPLRIGALLQPWLFFLLPNVAFTGAVLFTIAALSRRLTPVYICGFVLFMGSLITGEADLSIPVLDPAGITALKRISQDWTAAEMNSRLVGMSAGLMWNRVVWLTIAAGVLALLHSRFRFVHADGGGTKTKQHDALEASRAVPVAAMRVAPSFGVGTTARQVLSIARNSLGEVAWNPWFLGVLVVSAIWCGSLVESSTARPFDITTWPVTMLVTAVFSRDFIVGVYLLVGVYAGELVWKDRDVGVAEIADAAPVDEGTVFAGRLVALLGIAAMALAASIVGGMLGQVAFDYYNVEPMLYARVMFGMNMPKVALMAVLVMTVHVVVNHKYLGIIAMLAALVIPFTGGLLKHYLLVYNGDAGFTYSDMNGFGPFLAPFMWLKLYSAGWALLLAVVASTLWVRGRNVSTRDRLLQARGRFSGPLRRAAGAAVGIIVVVGGFNFYNTNVLNAFDADKARGALQAVAEKRYAQFANIPQPTIERARLRVEIYPDKQTVDVSGAYYLVNRTGAPIDSIHVSTDRLVARSIALDRDAKLVVEDTAVGYRIYALGQSLAPGDSMQLAFDTGFRQRGFLNSGVQTDVVDNGTYFGRGWLPSVGYYPARERSDYGVNGEDQVHVDAIIGTADDQVAITSGVLRKEWREKGRRYFHYETERPESFEVPIISGRYTMRSDRWIDTSLASKREVMLRVYHHPGHDRNTDSFVRSMKASLDYYSAQFGPYDGSELRIVEVPRYHREVRTHPGMVVFSEGRFIARTVKGQTDKVFVATAHEIAHQWWGWPTGGALEVHDTPNPLMESLASYSALMVTEKEYGAEVARRIHAKAMDRYTGARALTPNEEPPDGRPLELTMYTLRGHIGEARVNSALRRVRDKHLAGALPTELDVVAELRAVTPDSLRYLLTDPPSRPSVAPGPTRDSGR